ncbi:hypothetical protein BX666DRAFT_1888402 [Dichotomocladium elegans]|nr:hypothetical protein BX666DRAFT_1888402 [Dichotomocladium elegans]
MVQIPPSAIISSKLSPLKPADIPRILQCVQANCSEHCLAHHLRCKPDIALVAIGISNPHDMQRAMAANVPVIHIEKDCEALQGAYRRHVRDVKYIRLIHGLLSSSLWGFFLAFGRGYRYRRLYPALLAAYTVYFFRSLRQDYNVVEDKDQFLLIRDDAQRTGFQFIVKLGLPYSIQSLSIYLFSREIHSFLEHN